MLWDVRYNWQTTGLGEILFRGVEATTADGALERTFKESGHDNREAFFRDFEAVPTTKEDE